MRQTDSEKDRYVSPKYRERGEIFNVNIADDCPPVLADPKLIERVFMNLFENALYVMPAGGHLSIALRTIARGPRDTVVEAAISDDGPGMPEDVRHRVFDPHFTTKPDGTGLGLAMCKRIITVHHGGISEIGRASCRERVYVLV